MTSKLVAMQARFQQKQMQEKEEKLLKLYENQQQRAFERVGKGSAGSNTSVGSNGGGKVRQMFDERRQKAGIDKSYPLEPINGNRTKRNPMEKINKNPPSITRVAKTTSVQRTVTHIRNGKPQVIKKETRYSNDNGVVNYEEKSFGDKISKNHLVDLLNRNNIYDNIDDEEIPALDYDEVDDITGKLSNVGGKLPSQKEKSVEKEQFNSYEIKKTNVKPIQKKSPVRTSPTVKPAGNTTSQAKIEQKSNSFSPRSSPENIILNKMTTRAPNRQQPISPSKDRPSVKQTNPRSPLSTVVRDDLQECSHCGRRFASDRINTHEDVCARTTKKQRKPFDSFKHRITGTEIEQYAGPKKGKSKLAAARKPVTNQIGASKKNWRRTHEEFIAAIRSAKMAQAHLAKGGKLSDLPPPPVSSNPDYVQCPHCGRRFNEVAAERHIPKCSSYQFNKPKPEIGRAHV